MLRKETHQLDYQLILQNFTNTSKISLTTLCKNISLLLRLNTKKQFYYLTSVTGNSCLQLFLHHKFQIKHYTEVLFPHLHLNFYYFQHLQFKMSGNIPKKKKTLNMKRLNYLQIFYACSSDRSFCLGNKIGDIYLPTEF